MTMKMGRIDLRYIAPEVMREIETISAETGASVPEVARRLLAGAVASRINARNLEARCEE